MGTGRFWRAAIALVGVVALTGCEGKVATSLEVQGDGKLAARVNLEFAGEIAEILTQDEAQSGALRDLIVSRLRDANGVSAPAREEDERAERIETATRDGRLVWSMWVSEEELLANRGLLGVSGAVSDVNGESATVVVTMKRPEELVQAIADAVAGRPDSAALAAAYQENTIIEILVAFPGEISASDGSGVVEGSRYTVRIPLSEAGERTVSATGSLKDSGGLWPGLALVLALVLVGAYGLWHKGRARG